MVLFRLAVRNLLRNRRRTARTVGAVLVGVLAVVGVLMITGRLEAVPEYLESARTRAVVPQVRLWQGIEIEAAAGLPLLTNKMFWLASPHVPATPSPSVATESTLG